MSMYTIKVTLHPKNDKQHQDVWRILHVPKNSNLGKLMQAIDISFDWSAIHLSWFITSDNKVIPDFENDQDFDVLYKMPIVENINKFPFEYEYSIYDDLRDGWMHTIEIMETSNDNVGENCIVCVDGHGLTPPFLQEDNYNYYPPNNKDDLETEDMVYIANIVDLETINKKLKESRKPYTLKSNST
jgi:hypothetical protein